MASADINLTSTHHLAFDNPFAALELDSGLGSQKNGAKAEPLKTFGGGVSERHPRFGLQS